MHSDTMTREWMPLLLLLLDGMLGPDADPDVKRMVLEAADRACINQIYPDGATKQQWDAFTADYMIRQILWARDNPVKLIGCTRHMHAWVAMPQRDLRPGGRRHGMPRRQPQPKQRVPIG